MSLLTDYVAHPIRLVRGMRRARHTRVERALPADASHRPSHVELAPLTLEDAGDVYVLRFEVPGVERTALTVETFDDRIVVHGRRTPHVSLPGSHCLVDETQSGEFEREVMLPEVVEPDHVRAHYLDGILEVHAPKRQSRGG